MEKPFFVELLENNDPELLEHMNSLYEFATKDGALPARIKILMSMFADALLSHPSGVKALAERARAHGASEQEITETVRMAFLCGGMPGLVTGTYSFQE